MSSYSYEDPDCKYCTHSKKCNLCRTEGCTICITTVCSDCCIEICKECRDNDDLLCECFGMCTNCDSRVDRGTNGWPCDTCDKWLCSDCLDINGCDQCR